MFFLAKFPVTFLVVFLGSIQLLTSLHDYRGMTRIVALQRGRHSYNINYTEFNCKMKVWKLKQRLVEVIVPNFVVDSILGINPFIEINFITLCIM